MLSLNSTVRTDRFIKDYKMPINATLVFLAILVALLLLRIYEQSVLAEILPGKNKSGKDYATLLSTDKVDGVTKNDVKEEEQAKQEEQKKTETAASANTFTVSSGGSSGTTSPTDGGGTTPPPDTGGTGGTTTPPPTSPPPNVPLRVEEVTVTLESKKSCPAPAASPPPCWEYTFKGIIRTWGTVSGLVNYQWQHGPPMGSKTGEYHAPAGLSSNPVFVTFTVPCTQSQNGMTVGAMLHTVSPNDVQGNASTQHSC